MNTTIEALTSEADGGAITPETGYNVWRFDDENDGSKQTLLGTFGTEAEAIKFARRNGGHQIQRSTDGMVDNFSSDPFDCWW